MVSRAASLFIGFLVFVGVAFFAGVYIGGEATPRDLVVTGGTAWGVSIGGSPSELLDDLAKSYPGTEMTLVVYRDHAPRFEVVRGLANARADQLRDAREVAVLGVGNGASELIVSFRQGRISRLLMRERAFDL